MVAARSQGVVWVLHHDGDPRGLWKKTKIDEIPTSHHIAWADIDGDGLPDILAGMYWIRSPESFELPWRLFAIDLWNETPESAMLRLSEALEEHDDVQNVYSNFDVDEKELEAMA